MSETNAPVPLKRIIALTPQRLRLAESAYNTHFVLVEKGTKQETVLDPAFWAHVAKKFTPLDRIEVMDDEGTWLMVLLVRAVGAQSLTVVELWTKALGTAKASEPLPAEFEVRWRGNNYKWSVVRLSDKAVLKENMGTREEAEAWVRSHLKAMAA